jgi:signal transduction histidine kinase
VRGLLSLFTRDRLSATVRSLRFRLLLWNAGAVLFTGLFILLAVREGVRYTLIFDLDEVLQEDLKEIDLHFTGGEQYDWFALQEELDRKAKGHDFHRWFVQFYDDQGRPTWSSINTPDLPPLTAEQREARSLTLQDYRVAYHLLPQRVEQANAALVGCSQRFIARDLELIDRLVVLVFSVLLLLSPLVGVFLTSRTINPLAQMIRTTARLRPGDLEERVPIRHTGDELDRLAHTVNGLLDRISDYLRQEHDFLANAAHELRTPLAAIRSSVEVALNGDRSEEEYRELLNLVIDQCLALQTLVNQLLLLAETDADRLKADPEPVRLDRLVRNAAEMFEGVAEDRGVHIRLGEIAEVAVAGNRHHLRQVINNLLDNAIKFTAAHHAVAGPEMPLPGIVSVELTRDRTGRYCLLQVRDNGVGIAAEDLPQVFERFYRADKSRGRDGSAAGSGLGLSICRAIVESHRGTIHAASRPGKDTVFTVKLPLVTSG